VSNLQFEEYSGNFDVGEFVSLLELECAEGEGKGDGGYEGGEWIVNGDESTFVLACQA